MLQARKIVSANRNKSAAKSNVKGSDGITSTFASVKLAPSSASGKTAVKSSIFAFINLTPSTAPEVKAQAEESTKEETKSKKDQQPDGFPGSQTASEATDEEHSDNDDIQPASDEEVLFQLKRQGVRKGLAKNGKRMKLVSSASTATNKP